MGGGAAIGGCQCTASLALDCMQPPPPGTAAHGHGCGTAPQACPWCMPHRAAPGMFSNALQAGRGGRRLDSPPVQEHCHGEHAGAPLGWAAVGFGCAARLLLPPCQLAAAPPRWRRCACRALASTPAPASLLQSRAARTPTTRNGTWSSSRWVYSCFSVAHWTTEAPAGVCCVLRRPAAPPAAALPPTQPSISVFLRLPCSTRRG